MAGWVWCCRVCHWVWFEMERSVPAGGLGDPDAPFECTRCGNQQTGSE